MRLHGPIKDPVGRLIGRALPQRQLCAEPRCDEGTLLDSGRVRRRPPGRAVANDPVCSRRNCAMAQERHA